MVVDLRDRLCTGEIKIIELNYEYDLHFAANSMLVHASAGFNMDMAVVRVDPVKT